MRGPNAPATAVTIVALLVAWGASAATADSPALASGQRLTLRVGGGAPRLDHPVTFIVGDRLRRGGVTATVCLRSGGARTCRRLPIAAGTRAAGLPWRLRHAGPATVDVLGPGGQRLTRSFTVRRTAGRLTLMTAGDSEIQSVDGFLANRVRPFGVRTFKDARPGSKLSFDQPLDWPRHAAGVAPVIRADVVVMEIGLNEGYPMTTDDGTSVPCCDTAWVHELAHRARKIMASYIRGGAVRVYWLLLPPPRGDGLKAIQEPVNAAWIEAARAFPASVTLVDQRPLFPDGTPRSPDELHLTATQDLRIARILAAQMRHDGVI